MLSQSWALPNTCNFESWFTTWCLESRNKIGMMCYYVCCKGAWYSNPYAFFRLCEKKLQWLISTRMWKGLRKQLPTSLRTKMKITLLSENCFCQLFFVFLFLLKDSYQFFYSNSWEETNHKGIWWIPCFDPAEQLNL